MIKDMAIEFFWIDACLLGLGLAIFFMSVIVITIQKFIEAFMVVFNRGRNKAEL